MDDATATADGPHEALRIGDVSLDQLAADAFERRSPLSATHQAANVSAVVSQGSRDPRADEPSSAGQEDHVVKFFQ